MHPLSGTLLLPYVPERFTRGVLAILQDPCALLSVYIGDLNAHVFDGVN